MTYEVHLSGQVYMQTTDEGCRYPARIEAEMLQAGYEIYIDGKRIKKAGAERAAAER